MQLFERSLPEFRSLNASSTFEKVGRVPAEKSARSVATASRRPRPAHLHVAMPLLASAVVGCSSTATAS
jgi:hypothetical protein